MEGVNGVENSACSAAAGCDDVRRNVENIGCLICDASPSASALSLSLSLPLPPNNAGHSSSLICASGVIPFELTLALASASASALMVVW